MQIFKDKDGQYLAKHPDGTGPVIVLCPLRSKAWDIAADCINEQMAMELAKRIIKTNDKVPFWSNAAQQIHLAYMKKFMYEKPGKWGFQALERGDKAIIFDNMGDL